MVNFHDLHRFLNETREAATVHGQLKDQVERSGKIKHVSEYESRRKVSEEQRLTFLTNSV